MKTYKFQVATGKNKVKQIEVREVDLTKEQKELMLGDLIDRFNANPRDVQMQFLILMVDQHKGKEPLVKVQETKIISLTPNNIK